MQIPAHSRCNFKKPLSVPIRERLRSRYNNFWITRVNSACLFSTAPPFYTRSARISLSLSLSPFPPSARVFSPASWQKFKNPCSRRTAGCACGRVLFRVLSRNLFCHRREEGLSPGNSRRTRRGADEKIREARERERERRRRRKRRPGK